MTIEDQIRAVHIFFLFLGLNTIIQTVDTSIFIKGVLDREKF